MGVKVRVSAGADDEEGALDETVERVVLGGVLELGEGSGELELAGSLELVGSLELGGLGEVELGGGVDGVLDDAGGLEPPSPGPPPSPSGVRRHCE